MVFRVARVELGCDISYVREVLKPQEIYHLPQTPDFIEGVIHLRGQIVALMDLGKRLHLHSEEEDGNKRIIICRVHRFTVGLMVNSLSQIIAISQEEVKPIPELVSMQMEAEVISGLARVGRRIIPILDLEQIVTKKEVTELSAWQ